MWVGYVELSFTPHCHHDDGEKTQFQSNGLLIYESNIDMNAYR
jgi:hypothetical protein